MNSSQIQKIARAKAPATSSRRRFSTSFRCRGPGRTHTPGAGGGASADDSKPLKNARHEVFSQKIAQGMSATDAHAEAGYKRDRRAASKLATKYDISARVAFLQSQAAERTLVTIESTTLELEKARMMAMNALNTGDMIRATMGKARLAGLLVDKHMVGMKNIADMTEAELRVLLGRPG